MESAKCDWFGPRLREAREKAGLTQEELAELVQVALQTVKDWEKGRKCPMLERVPLLAEILGVPAGSFFPDTPDRVQEGRSTYSLDERLERVERQLSRVLGELRALRGDPANPSAGTG